LRTSLLVHSEVNSANAVNARHNLRGNMEPGFTAANHRLLLETEKVTIVRIPDAIISIHQEELGRQRRMMNRSA
ncbi:hypothetical protein BGX31_010892, partial [Mortierella sp. GBA43]